MADNEMTEKEYAVIHEISASGAPDQRKIAAGAGISLGMTNLIIKRLIKQGYVKAKQLNKKKIQYILTPDGFAEKARKSYAYTRKTVGMLKSFNERLKALLTDLHSRGARKLVIEGINDELEYILGMALSGHELSDLSVQRARRGEGPLTISSYDASGARLETVQVIEYLSQTGLFFQ